MKRKCFIFDLDGVIVDTAKYHYQAWKALANDLGIDFSIEQNEQLKGVSRVQSLEKILKWGGRTLDPIEFQDKMNQKNTNYLEYISNMDTSELLPDVDRVLRFLTNNNQFITLGSASKNARPILDKVKITSLFDAIVDGNDVSKAKPNPEVFLKAARLTKSKAKNCIVFEDSVAGIQAANAAGMISIGIGDARILHEAQYNFEDFRGLSNTFLENLIKKS
ncbi:beta-phosphoglucomutase [Flavobacteriaceae bacterium]|jgi:beta-phosphoglucomutase|nr:beta-phosphoglucomutase [Flavobacteriaceae bacterium]CAI8412610.1 MAG: Beta-phosphoglucomutase [Formosa sp. Hel3_A1_48]